MKFTRKDYQRRIVDLENEIPEDEPVFLLRAQDQYAAMTVRFWASLVERGGGSPDTVKAAVAIAGDMDVWPVKKMPDPPEEGS